MSNPGGAASEPDLRAPQRGDGEATGMSRGLSCKNVRMTKRVASGGISGPNFAQGLSPTGSKDHNNYKKTTVCVLILSLVRLPQSLQQPQDGSGATLAPQADTPDSGDSRCHTHGSSGPSQCLCGQPDPVGYSTSLGVSV